MFRTFFWASACGGSTNATTPSTIRSPRAVASQLKRDMDFSSFARRGRGERDRGPGLIRDVFDEHRAERDSSMTTSVESVQDGSRGFPARVGGAGIPVKIGRYDIRTGGPLQVVADGSGVSARPDAQATRRISPATRSSTGSTVSAFAGSRLKTRRATPASR